MPKTLCLCCQVAAAHKCKTHQQCFSSQRSAAVRCSGNTTRHTCQTCRVSSAKGRCSSILPGLTPPPAQPALRLLPGPPAQFISVCSSIMHSPCAATQHMASSSNSTNISPPFAHHKALMHLHTSHPPQHSTPSTYTTYALTHMHANKPNTQTNTSTYT